MNTFKISEVLFVFFFILLLSLTSVFGSNGMDKKTLIIGIDGADPELILNWTQQGELPNIKSIMEKGSYSNLTTTIPIISPSAWTSFSTGTNPGKHGIFSFVKREGEGVNPVTSKDKKVKDLWEILGEEDKKVVVMNVPLTYPPEEVNGALISGFLASTDRTFTYPSNLSDELRREDYLITGIESQYDPARKEAFFKNLKRTINKREEVALELMEEREWDCFIVVFRVTDTAQHYLWDDKDKILELYKEVDGAVGKLTNKAPEETFTMILSDHGFGKMNKEFYLNRFLMKEGYLKLKSGFKTILINLGLTQHNIAKSLKKIGVYSWLTSFLEKLNLRKSFKENLPEVSSLNSIDFSKSEAYATTYGKGIYVQDQKTKEEIRGELSSKKFLDVYKKGEVLKGFQAKNAPDLFVDSKNCLPVGFLGFRKVLDNNPIKQGKHRRQGILVSNKKFVKDNTKITDIAPTILDFFNISRKDYMDGRSLISFRK